MKKAINTTANVVVNTFLTLLGTFVASSIFYTFYMVLFVI